MSVTSGQRISGMCVTQGEKNMLGKDCNIRECVWLTENEDGRWSDDAQSFGSRYRFLTSVTDLFQGSDSRYSTKNHDILMWHTGFSSNLNSSNSSKAEMHRSMLTLSWPRGRGSDRSQNGSQQVEVLPQILQVITDDNWPAIISTRGESSIVLYWDHASCDDLAAKRNGKEWDRVLTGNQRAREWLTWIKRLPVDTSILWSLIYFIVQSIEQVSKELLCILLIITPEFWLVFHEGWSKLQWATIAASFTPHFVKESSQWRHEGRPLTPANIRSEWVTRVQWL